MIETTFEVGGAVVFWTACAFTDRDKLIQGLAPLGLDEFVPEPRPAASILRDALEETLGTPRTLVRPLARRDGFTVIKEERGPNDNCYVTELIARVRDVDPPSIDFTPWDERASRVNAAFERHKGRLPAVQLSACLVKLVECLGGTRLRPTGAVYWIPGPKLDEWASIANAVESASEGKPSAVYLLRHRLDADAVRAIRDAVVAEVQSATSRIAEDIAAGELGNRALETRKQQAHDLREKVLLYEDLLNVGLADLHQAIDSADQSAATASLLLAAQTHLSASLA